MGKAVNIKDLQDLVQEQDRKFLDAVPDHGEEKDKALERAEVLKKGGEVKFSAKETIRDVYQASKQTHGMTQSSNQGFLNRFLVHPNCR